MSVNDYASVALVAGLWVAIFGYMHLYVKGINFLYPRIGINIVYCLYIATPFIVVPTVQRIFCLSFFQLLPDLSMQGILIAMLSFVLGFLLFLIRSLIFVAKI